MKRIFILVVAMFFTKCAFSQSPERLSYQAVIRDAGNNLVTNQSIEMQISILQGSISGSAVYVETQSPTTNENGLVSIEIGAGVVISCAFSTIDWTNGPYFIKSETDPDGTTGGIVYTITGTNQLLSVPYALHSKTADSLSSGISENDPVFGAWDRSTGISITESQISNLDHFTNGDETDPVFSSSIATGITATDTSNWNNKLDSYTETDPVFGAWDRSTGISITESQISDLDHFTNSDETDPIYTISQAANITATDITNLSNLSGTNTGDQDGSETKINAGTNVSVSGIGTTSSPYVVNAIGATTYSVGDFAQGGIVMWVDETGQHGLVCAKEDQSSGFRWYAGTFGSTFARGDGPFSGEANTAIIIAAQIAIGDDGGSNAVKICNELIVTEGGKSYGDWYLPSKEELNMMYQNMALINATAVSNGGSSFAVDYYWSSTEVGIDNAWCQYFGDGVQSGQAKSNFFSIRAIRAF